MSRFAICLVTDEKYVLPTMVAAIWARQAAPQPDVDVFIFALGLSGEATVRYEAIASAYNLRLVTVSRGIFGGSAENAFIDQFFRDSPFTFGALGRLFLDQLLPAEYDHILYIDGDVQIAGSLRPLLEVQVPRGCFLAAADPKVFWVYDNSHGADRERRYMAGLNLNPNDFGGYFNSGVLRICRSGWREIGMQAFRFLLENPNLCICHDQSALNAVARDRRLPMSLRWNFPVYWDFYGIRSDLRPVITHFMSRPKPWNGAFPPWGSAGHRPYLDFVAEHPDVQNDLSRYGLAKALRYHLQQRYKWVDETIHAGRRHSVSQQALAYEQTAIG